MSLVYLYPSQAFRTPLGDVRVLLPDRACNPFRNFYVCFPGASSHWASLANLLKNALPKTTLSNACAVLTGSSLKIQSDLHG